MRRRDFLTAFGASSVLALAGCSAGGGSDTETATATPTPTPTPEPTETPDTDLQESFDEAAEEALPEEKTFVDESVSIPAGDWHSFNISLNEQTDLDLQTTVREGPAVDVIMMQQSEFEHYSSGDRFRFYDEFSQLDTVGDTTTSTFLAGDYVLVIDNTDAVEAKPPETEETTSQVDVSLTAEF